MGRGWADTGRPICPDRAYHGMRSYAALARLSVARTSPEGLEDAYAVLEDLRSKGWPLG